MSSDETGDVRHVDASAAFSTSKPHEEPQRWLSELREMRYRNLLRVLQPLKEKEGQEGIQKWFLNLTNKRIVDEGREPLNSENISSLNLRVIQSDAASEIAEREIIRPVFVFEDKNELRNFHERFTGQAFEGSLHTSLLIEDVDAGWGDKTGLIITNPDDQEIDHEIAHSIDPHERFGADKIINELFAYMTIIHYHDDASGVSREQLQTHLTNALSHEAYFKLLSRQPSFGLTYDQFKTLCNASVDVALTLREENGDLESLRKIVQAKNLDILFGYVGTQQPSFN